MPNFWSLISNGKYSVGCTGQAVFIYDKNGKELARFKDLTYAYTSAISPKGDIFVVKSTKGRMAVYSLEELCLIKKIRFSKVDYAQDENFCFSPDGKLFYNIERHNSDLETALSIYRTSDFSLEKRLLSEDRDTLLDSIEYDSETNCYYILGFFRNRNNRNVYFVAKLIDDQLNAIRRISEKDWWHYLEYKKLEMSGFAKKAIQWSEFDGCDLCDIKNKRLSLAKLWMLSAE